MISIGRYIFTYFQVFALKYEVISQYFSQNGNAWKHKYDTNL